MKAAHVFLTEQEFKHLQDLNYGLDAIYDLLDQSGNTVHVQIAGALRLVHDPLGALLDTLENRAAGKEAPHE